jgi:hypothetical protein
MNDIILRGTGAISSQLLENPHFRKGFCLKPGFRFENLRPYCRELVFCTDGFKTGIWEIRDQLSLSFEGFDPMQDCIIPTGTGITNILTGYLLRQRFPESSICIAFYQNKIIKNNRIVSPEMYKFYRLPINNFF